jgi:hypothetical protein
MPPSNARRRGTRCLPSESGVGVPQGRWRQDDGPLYVTSASRRISQRRGKVESQIVAFGLG